MSALDDFKLFVQDAQAAAYYAKWSSQNPGALAKWVGFRDALLRGERPAVPDMGANAYGRSLIDAGVAYLNATGIAPDPNPTPTPTPTPDPGGAPAFKGPWFDPASPWRTPITGRKHPDSADMVQGVYIGTDYSANDIHAFAYRPVEMQAKWGTAGLTYMKWLGPGGNENIIYAPTGTPTIPVVSEFTQTTPQVPMPLGWTGFKTASSERRTSVICEDGTLWNLYGLKTPAQTGDGKWHATIAATITGGWKATNPTWLSGGTGYPHLVGIVTPFDVVYAREHGDFGHALALNWQSSADGSYTAHPKNVPSLPSTKNSDGRTKTIVGIPVGSNARVYLDPALSETEARSLGVTKTWMMWFVRTFQKYGGIAKESTTGQGGAGGIMCETLESVAWNKAHGFYPSDFQYDWIADGTCTGDHDNSTYNAALPPALVPTSGSRWAVQDWRNP